MTVETQIYAKEQQIKIIDNILCSLCSLELTSDGRKYLKKMREKIANELVYLKSLSTTYNNTGESNSRASKFKFPSAIKIPW